MESTDRGKRVETTTGIHVDTCMYTHMILCVNKSHF